MNRFGENSKAFFDNVYHQNVPWEVGSIQPELLKLIKSNPPVGKILDIGCGIGDTTIDLARLGYEVVGIDFVETAIERARQNAKQKDENGTLKISFLCGNGLQPTKIGKDFGAIVDSGFLHLFDDDEVDEYIEELNAALTAKGRVYLIEFAYEFEIPNAPRAIKKETLQKMFGEDKWAILSIEDGSFINKVASVPAVIACIEKKN